MSVNAYGRSVDSGRVNGKHLVAAMIAVIAVVAGGLMFQGRPKSNASLLPILRTETGDMVLIPAGRFLHGANRETAIVPGFYIDRTEVSNGAYRRFCKETGEPIPPQVADGPANFPVAGIEISGATAFAKWAGKRLPDAMEWEKAARGTDGRQYPWGSEADSKRANVSDDASNAAAVPVDAFPEGASPFGVLNMIGNVAEFVRNDVVPNAEARSLYRELLKPPPGQGEPWFSVKGGSFKQRLAESLPWTWSPVPVRWKAANIGFRCVKDVPQ